MVDFLSIAPPETRKELVTVLDHMGQEQQVEIQPVDNTDLAKLARQKHPGLRALFRKGADKEQFAIVFMEHAPAIVAAALGHLGDEKYEAAVKRFDQVQRQKLIDRIMILSFGEAEEEDGAPLATAEEVIAEATAAASEAP